jgi:hypothetical protein
MHRTIITPDTINVYIQIPEKYIGKNIEILVYSTDELKEESNTINQNKKKPSDYVGCISKETAQDMLVHIEQSRKEWERDI